MTTSAGTYVLGASDQELHRLLQQGEAYGPLTEEALRRAGIAEGMRVLDVATGLGDVAMIAARLVGPTGRVTAVDRAPEMLEHARRRSAAARLDRIRFEQADLAGWTTGERFDAVVGRLILMHLDDPVGVLRRVAALVRPGGLLVMADFAMSSARQVPPGPVFTTALDRMLAAFRAAGRPTDVGLELPRLFRAAGLPVPQLLLGGIPEAGAGAYGYAMLAGVTRTLLPVMEKAGLVDPGALDPDRLEAELRAEADALDATGLPPLLVTAWTHVG